MNLQGEFQIASFHPDYRFAETTSEDVTNYTNRSPYPILHLLREASLEKAIERHGNTEQIPHANMRLMRELGATRVAGLLRECQPGEPS
jgi:hypothetical protein